MQQTMMTTGTGTATAMTSLSFRGNNVYNKSASMPESDRIEVKIHQPKELCMVQDVYRANDFKLEWNKY